MEAGRLRHRVTIQRRLESRDTYGGEAETWSDVATVWAEISPLIGREYIEARQETGELPVKIRMRYRSGIQADMRLQWTDETAAVHRYELTAPPQNVEGRRREMILMCREIN